MKNWRVRHAPVDVDPSGALGTYVNAQQRTYVSIDWLMSSSVAAEVHQQRSQAECKHNLSGAKQGDQEMGVTEDGTLL